MSEPGRESEGEWQAKPGEDATREVLSRLPHTRPGRRSPLRDEAPKAPKRRPERATEPVPEPARPDTAGVLTGVAKTGAEVAVGAVGLGLRAAGGALRALRGTSERP